MAAQAQTVLSLLCTRAMVVLAEAAPSMSTARYLSSGAASLSSLVRNTPDTLLLRFTNAFVQRLAFLLPLLRTVEPLQEEVAISIFRIAKNNGSGNISPACIDSVLKEVDERLVGSQFALWKPQTIIASLHAIAVASPSGSLNMVDTLLFCAKEQLPRLDERSTARLLWCVATLHKEAAHATLWRALCGRLVRFSKVITPTSLSLVVEALFIVPGCMCDAQQELLCVLHETRLAGKDSETFHGEEEAVMGNDYQALKDRLLSDAHLLPVESIIHMLSRTSGASLETSDEVNYLLQCLLRRSLKPAMCRELLEFLATIEKSEVTQALRAKAVECICAGDSSDFSGTDNVLRDLASICVAVVLERHQTLGVSMGARKLLEEFIVKCHDVNDTVWGRCSGRIAGVLAVALDVLGACGQTSVRSPSLAGSVLLLEQFPEAWERGGCTSAEITECVACVCSACDLLRVPALLRTPLSASTSAASPVEATMGGDMSGTQGGRTDALLRRCTKVFAREGTFLPSEAVFDMWRAAAGAAGTCLAALQPLMEWLLNYTEEHPADFSLMTVTRFLGANHSRLPAEAVELFVRCLTKESDGVTPTHLDVLVTSLEGAAGQGDTALLQRLQLMLFLRPLGHERALIHAVSFTTPQLVRLFKCCSLASDLTASMQATLLELIISSCGRCATMAELNTAASLLSQLQRGPLKDALARSLAVNARRMPLAVTPDVQKALLIVYLQKGGVAVAEDLRQALQCRA
ncbi:hypothetical protein TRSC58_05094 [Trypanosoma rangeli SC58]|uniref:Uncharacterized protein n=1 Tax=Trypanosoma rangeli SC58 TaxID=429131 RepID=A0A061J1R6_TRYRA|nr:hypothetical protein TRSC58_05094 [Trypanosoma rangeli SC58]